MWSFKSAVSFCTLSGLLSERIERNRSSQHLTDVHVTVVFDKKSDQEKIICNCSENTITGEEHTGRLLKAMFSCCFKHSHRLFIGS